MYIDLSICRGMAQLDFFLYKFSPNPLIDRIGKDRAPATQSLLRWPCPLPSDRAISGLWQNFIYLIILINTGTILEYPV